MKNNLLISSYDYELSKRIAVKLADVFSMRYFDQIELFEFDHTPMSFAEIYRQNGRQYVEKKFRSIVKMELDFDDTVLCAHLSFAKTCGDIFYHIKLSNLVVLLYENSDEEAKKLLEKQYNSSEEREFFAVDAKQLKECEDTIKAECADILVDTEDKTDNEIIGEIVLKINQFYKLD